MSGNNDFVIENGILTKYNGPGGAVAIPEGVTAIYLGVFENCANLTQIKIPEGVTIIGAMAFQGCTNLTKIDLPDSVTQIDRDAFRDCTGLTNITIPRQVSFYRYSQFESAFAGCLKLKDFRVAEDNPHLTVRDGALYNKDQTVLIAWPSAEGAIAIPSTVTQVAEGAFSGCIHLTHVTFLSCNIQIGYNAFRDCTALEKVTVPGELTDIYFLPQDTAIELDPSVPFPAKPSTAFSFGVILTPFQAAQCLMTQSGKLWQEAVWRNITAENAQLMAETLVELCASKKQKNKARETRLVEFLARYERFLKCETAAALKAALPGAAGLPEQEWVLQDGVVIGSTGTFQEQTLPDFVPIAPDALKHADGKIVRISPKNTGIDLEWLAHAEISPAVETLRVPAAWLVALVGETGELPVFSPDVTTRLTIEQAEKLRKMAAIERLVAIGQQIQGMSLVEALAAYGHGLSVQRRVELCRENLLTAIPSLPQDFPVTEESFCRLVPEGKDRDVYRLMTSALFEVEEIAGMTFAASGGPAPAEAVETLLFRLSFCCTDHWMDSVEIRFLQLLNRSELERFLEVHCKVESDGSWDAVAALPAVCLLCGARQAKRLVRVYQDLAGRELFAGGIRDQIRKGIEEWLPCNENPDALRALLRDQWLLCQAAERRSMRMEELSMLLLEQAETGLDQKGQAALDYGGRRFTVTLLPDLTLSIQNEETGKLVKSLPRAGKEDDAAKAKAANETYKGLKSTVQTLFQGQKERLFQMFLQGDAFQAARWSSAYRNNPVLQRVAALLVWNQKESCFTLSPDGEPIDAAGAAVDLGSDDIRLAHPMEMQSEEVAAWQRYFTSRGLKQFFAQVWEPVVNFDAVRENRYQGMHIPAYRFKGQEKHGISFEFYYDSSELYIGLDDCHLDYDGWGGAIDRHYLDLQGELTLGTFQVNRRSRRANHIIGLLDKWTVYGRVLKDDAMVVDVLDSFTLAQVTELLNLAVENSCTNCTAALLEYKNTHFADLDPMDVFTLE